MIMNLAKFIFFCKDFNIVYDRKKNAEGLKLPVLQNMFKLIAPDTRSLEFKEFKTLIDHVGVRFYTKVRKKRVKKKIGNYDHVSKRLYLPPPVQEVKKVEKKYPKLESDKI